MKMLASHFDIIEANIVKGLLQQCGVEAHVSGFYLQGGIGEIPVSGNVVLWVEDDQILAARELLGKYEKGPE